MSQSDDPGQSFLNSYPNWLHEYHELDDGDTAGFQTHPPLLPWAFYSQPFGLPYTEPEDETVLAWVASSPSQHISLSGDFTILVRNEVRVGDSLLDLSKTGFRVSKAVMTSSSPFFMAKIHGPWSAIEKSSEWTMVTNVDPRALYELCMILHGRQVELSHTNASWLPSVIDLASQYQCTEKCAPAAGWYLNPYANHVDRKSHLAKYGLTIGNVIAIAKLVGFEEVFWHATSDAIYNYTRDDFTRFTDNCLRKHIDDDVVGAISSFVSKNMVELLVAADGPQQAQTAAAGLEVCAPVASRKGYYTVALERVGITAKAVTQGPLRTKVDFDRIRQDQGTNRQLAKTKKCKKVQGSVCAGCQFDFWGAVLRVPDQLQDHPPHGLCLRCFEAGFDAVPVVRCYKHNVLERTVQVAWR
ncbi:hypothetical protein LTR70_004486 [Exophiala xenobiotica]|uniref:BTB domain-containing protein n=1 Tax=Lithohypha guttulata TaxID=1690604 RepID=A0ABR0KNR0_9EURO|nr:hypothetical protein LTR24_000416 [Lithohypha guttulata]KAK5320404.1 hypothetical protein LTR70_004486 [Exophiala xenobiotica]